MTIAEVIRQADIIRPNTFDEDMKRKCVVDCEMKVRDRIFCLTPEDVMFMSDYGGEIGDETLLLQKPYENVYIYYLCMKIDFALRQFGEYNQDLTAFKDEFNSAAAWYRRGHRYRHRKERCNCAGEVFNS